MIHVACAADENYLPHCAAMLHSLSCHVGNETVSVHFLHPASLPKHELDKLQDLSDLWGLAFEAVEVDDPRVENLFSTKEISRVAWFRTLLPELCPNLNKVLYLDCDTLIVNSLIELWETDIDQYLAAAVCNVFEEKLKFRHLALGIPVGQPYFNSGVLLMNLAQMREEGSVSHILEHAKMHGKKLIWVDQDSLNLVLGKKCIFLHPRWNCQNSLFYWKSAREQLGNSVVNEATQNPAILHFEGPGLAKPWNPLCKHPYRAHYLYHLKSTLWFNENLDKLDWRNRLLRLLPMRMTPVLLGLAWRLKRKLLG